MRHTTRAILALLGSIGLAGCVTHRFAPGPGMSLSDFEPQSAQCRLFSRGSDPSFSMGAAGSEGFVAASMAGMAIGAGISTAVRRNANFNDCMEARGWRIADNVAQPPPVPVQSMALASTTGTVAQPPIRRRSMGIAVRPVVAELEYATRMSRPRGLIVMSAEDGGVASAAGLAKGDVLLSFQGRTLMSQDDLVADLRTTPPNSVVNATVWSDGQEREVQLHF